jgi:hypothetical protein
MNKLRAQLNDAIPEANIALFGPPPVRGVGRAGGWMLMVEDRGDVGPVQLQKQVENLVAIGNAGINLRGEPIRPLPDLRLMSSVNDPSEMPEEGKSLIVVSTLDHALHIRMFDGEGKMVVDTDEKELKPQGQKIEKLSKVLEPLWPPHQLTDSEKSKVVNDATDVVGHPLASERRAVAGLASVFRANVPQIYLDVDRQACMLKGVELRDVFETLQAYLGSLYVNDFNRFGRTWQVIVQAIHRFRDQKDDINRLQVRNNRGTMVPLGAVANVREINGPLILTRYNMYPAASINGNAEQGVSSGSAISAMEALSNRELPQTMSYEWTEMAYLELQAGNTAILVFCFSIVMVFLVLAAQFESWAMPLAVILSVPLCMLSALYGVTNAKLLGATKTSLDINIFTQIGLVVLVGLASKTSILIVQFATGRAAPALRTRGGCRDEAVTRSCRLQRNARRDFLRRATDPGVLLCDRQRGRIPLLLVTPGASGRQDRAGDLDTAIPLASVELDRSPTDRSTRP